MGYLVHFDDFLIENDDENSTAHSTSTTKAKFFKFFFDRKPS